MTCTQFRDSLDCYLDRELASDAMAAAERHRAVCAACDRLAARGFGLRAALQQAVSESVPPPGLDERIRSAMWGQPQSPRWMALAVAAVVVLSLAVAGDAYKGRVERSTANAMDRMAVGLNDASEVVLRGTLLCRDCELERRYGIEAPCKRIGHHGAIATADGHIWNLVEQKTAAELIHNEQLLGRQIVVHGRVFRGARTLVVERYEFTS